MTLHAEDRDPSVDPGTDFYRFANGGWMDANPIPAGFGAWGSFEEVLTRNEVVLRRELERGEHRTAGRPRAPRSATSTPRAWTPTPSRPPGSVRSSTSSTPSPRSTRRTAFLDLLALVPARGRPAAVRRGRHGRPRGLEPHTCCGSCRAASACPTATRTSPTARPRCPCARRTSTTWPPSWPTRAPGRRGRRELAPRVLELETRLAEPQLRAEERRDRGRTLNKHSLDELAALAPDLGLPATRGDRAPTTARGRQRVGARLPRGAARDRRRRPTSRCCMPTPSST